MSRDPGPELAGVVAFLRETYGLDPHAVRATYARYVAHYGVASEDVR